MHHWWGRISFNGRYQILLRILISSVLLLCRMISSGIVVALLRTVMRLRLRLSHATKYGINDKKK